MSRAACRALKKQVKAIYLLALRLIEQYARHGSRPLPDSTFFEFGSGRDLVVPLAISACGARQFITVDVERLAKLDLVRSNVGFVANLSGMTRPALSSWEDLRNSWRVDYRAPADARATGIESGTSTAPSPSRLSNISRPSTFPPY